MLQGPRRLDGEDLYFCPQDGSYVRRFGSEPSENGSLGSLAPAGTPYALAAQLWARASAGGAWRPGAYVTA